MPNPATQRDQWDGHLVELGDGWTLRKGERLARCVLFNHQLGWELRLMVGDLVRSQVCRSQDEILSTQENWKAAMVERGWLSAATATSNGLRQSSGHDLR